MDTRNWVLEKIGQIEDEFEGFDDEMIFELTDGSIYYQKNYKYHYHYAYRPNVKIFNTGFTKILVVDGINDYVEVELTTAIKSKIISDFKGWSGDTIFELQNGQIWKQAKYQYKYFYVYRPNVLIVRVGNKYIMNVKGKTIQVTKIK
jgi:hypothetical protein